MGNTEIINLNGKDFKVFKRIPIPISRKVQTMLIECAQDYEGPIEDLESGKASPRDVKGIDMELLYEIFDLLLTTIILEPKISKEDIDNINHDLQEYFEDLQDLLFAKFTNAKKDIKKKSLK